MPGVTLGFLKFILGFDSIAFRQGSSEAEAKLKTLQANFASAGKQMQSVGKTMSVALTLPFAGLAATGLREAQETAAAMAQVNAAIRSTGGAAGQSSEGLKKFADSLELHSLYEGDEILSKVSARLLGFGNITGQTFTRAQQAIVDYATRTKTDLSSATVLIGKALNDPARAMGVLRKAGVSLSEGQQQLLNQFIATGNAAGAQGVILDALTTKVGGAAQAAQDSDSWNALTDSFKSIAESVGTVFLPLLQPLAAALASVAGAFSNLSPETQKVIVTFGALLAAAGPTLVIAGKLTTAWAAVIPVLTKIGPAWAAVKIAMLAARAAAITTLPALAPFLVPLAALALAVGAVYLAWQHWDTIKRVVIQTYNAVANWLGDKLRKVLHALQAPIEWVANKFKWLGDVVVHHSHVPDMVVGVGWWMAKLPSLMSVPVRQATEETAEAFSDLRDKVDAMTGGADAEGGITEATDAASTGIEGMAGQAEDAKARMIESFGQMATGVIDSLRNMVDAFKNGGLLDKIESVLGVVKQVLTGLGQAGVIGMPPGGMSLAGARAAGGPVIGGKSYLVGERGPELFSPKRSGFVHANGAGQAARVMIVPTPYFDAHVDGRAARVAAPMAGRAAMAGAVGGHASVERAAARQFP